MSKKLLYCDKDEAERILRTIPDMNDLAKLSWYVGYLEGHMKSCKVLHEN